MAFDATFFLNSILLGAGLAMDAFSVSLANGLHEPKMRLFKMCGIAAVFAGFQIAMPLIGWECVRTVTGCFRAIEPFIPWIALALLGFIGGKMLIEGIRGDDAEAPAVGLASLIVQGIATSIDALSVGFTISHYNGIHALASCGIIGVVTFIICLSGLHIGKTVGTKIAGKAGILGGVILIAIGIEIVVTDLIA